VIYRFNRNRALHQPPNWYRNMCESQNLKYDEVEDGH